MPTSLISQHEEKIIREILACFKKMFELFAPQREAQPFNRYFADWMAGKVLKETTWRNWESAFWKHLYSRLKNWPLSTITPADVRLFQQTLVDKGLEPSIINDKPMKVLRMMLARLILMRSSPKTLLWG